LTFEADLVAHLTVLRSCARKLTRDREEAMDLVQETCERALRSRHFFQEGTNLRAWLLTIMRHRFLDGAKRRRDAMESGHSVALEELSGAHNGPRAEQICFVKEVLGFAHESLSEKQASIFWPTLEGATEAECMALRGVSRSTVVSRLHRVRCFMRRACAA
jgi:RNA polymerase sigma-70 factor (ECF subfamily)